MTAKIKYQPYPKYKDSGVGWLGKIPEGWDVSRLKYTLQSLESGSRELQDNLSEDANIPSIGGEHITWDGEVKFTNNKYITEEYFKGLKKGKIRKGDTLLVKDGATIGKTAFVRHDQDMAINEHVFILRALNEISPKLIYYFIISDKTQKIIRLLSQGAAQAGLSSEFASNIFITIPKKRRQERIINFLDKKTAQIDRLIQKNKRLIQLLEEKRQAIIAQAVTCGLDKKGNLKRRPKNGDATPSEASSKEWKESGVNWIGKIPKHWSEVPFKQAIINKTMKGKGLRLPFVALENIISNKGKLVEGFSWKSRKADDCSIFKRGDVLFGKLRPYLAKSLLADRNGCCPTELLVLRSKKRRLLPYYLYYLTLSKWFVDLCEANSYGVKMPRTSWGKFSQYYVFIPPLDEQKEIVRFLNQQIEVFDKTISKIRGQNQKLAEYRQALISNAVTGKIKV